MPYYLHRHDQTPESGDCYPTKAEALAHRGNRAMTFVVSLPEQIAWQSREADRLRQGVYTAVPWASYWTVHPPATAAHYAHLSLNHPGLIAYTPDDVYGVEDRQLRVKPAKYLAEFYFESMNRDLIAYFVAQVKAFDPSLLKFATTPHDCVRVYTTRGPSSCMTYALCEYRTGGIHPCTAYGGSDLAIAYMGTLGEHISARCVVWPAKLIYTRIYGDSALESLLRATGYQHGDLDGARIRIVRRPDGESSCYVVPYIDGACYGTPRNGWLVLSNHRGSLTVRETIGITWLHGDDPERTTECEHCGYLIDGDERLCNECVAIRWMCDGCNGEFFTDNDEPTNGGYYTYCGDCADDHRSRCAIDDCDTAWFETAEFTRAEQRTRHDTRMIDTCRYHWALYRYCRTCFAYHPVDDPCPAVVETAGVSS